MSGQRRALWAALLVALIAAIGYRLSVLRQPSPPMPKIAFITSGSGPYWQTIINGAKAAAVDRPRFHPVGNVVNAEPGVDEDALEALRAAGWDVRVWPGRHHYYGGVSLIAPAGAAADPRRSGAARTTT